jgi:hypothetical protein
VWHGWGVYPLKIKKNISRTKFESAQKRDASEFIPGVERLGLKIGDAYVEQKTMVKKSEMHGDLPFKRYCGKCINQSAEMGRDDINTNTKKEVIKNGRRS